MTHPGTATRRPITATAAELLSLFGVKPGTVRQWAHRGHVRRYGRNAYDVGDVLVRLNGGPGGAPTPTPS